MSNIFKKVNWKKLVGSFIIVFLVAFTGSLFTSSSTISEWYKSIRPDITPPNYVFPIVWNILFFLIALSLYFVCTSTKTNKERWKIRCVYGLNFVLNIFWSYLYFGIRRADLALVEIFFLWFSILGMIGISYKIDRRAAYLLVPYLAWVGFAIVLNYLTVF